MKVLRQSLFIILSQVILHIGLCELYNYICFSAEKPFEDRFTGILYWIVLITMFLGSLVVYYVSGRICKGKGNKKVVMPVLLVGNIIIAIFGIIGVFNDDFLFVYRSLNSSVYLHYTLFLESVKYIAFIGMVVSAMFPIFFFKLGYLKKPRTNNEIKMDTEKETEAK